MRVSALKMMSDAEKCFYRCTAAWNVCLCMRKRGHLLPPNAASVRREEIASTA